MLVRHLIVLQTLYPAALSVSWVLGECSVSEYSRWVERESSKEAAGAGGRGGGVHRHSRKAGPRAQRGPEPDSVEP